MEESSVSNLLDLFMKPENEGDSGNGSDVEPEKERTLEDVLNYHFKKFDKKTKKYLIPEIEIDITQLEEPFKIIHARTTERSPRQFHINLIHNDDTGEIYQDVDKHDYYKYEKLGVLKKNKGGLYLENEKDKVEKLTDDYQEEMLSLNTHKFLKFAKRFFKDQYLYDPSNINWYYNEEGKWKSSNSGKENFHLSNNIKEKFYRCYEEKENFIKKMYNQELSKVDEKGGLRYKGGALNKSKTEYIEGNVQFKDDSGKWSNVEKGGAFEAKFAMVIDLHESLTICQHYIEKIGEAFRYVPIMVDRLREYFTCDDLYKKFDNDPYVLSFDNCYINLTDTLKTGKVYPLPHHCKNFTAMSTKGNFMRKNTVQKQIDELEYNVGRCFNDPEKYEIMMKTKAYSLFGENPMKVIFINYGRAGNNGKGFVDTLMKASLGDYHETISSDLIIQGNNRNFDPERPQPALCRAMKKRFVSLSEIEPDAKLCGKSIKLIRGGDTLCVRTLNKEPISLVPHFTIDCGFNNIGEIDTADMALRKSIFIIHFEVEFKEKSGLFEEETKYYKFSNELKTHVKNEKNYKYGSAWLWMLLPRMESKFDNHPDFETVKADEINSTDYVREFYENSITDTTEMDNKRNDKAFHHLQPMNVYRKATYFYKSLNQNVPTKKNFIEQFDRIIPKERQINDGKTHTLKTLDGTGKKSVRSYYRNYEFTSVLETAENRD